MGMLIKLLKAVFSAALLNKAIRSVFIASLIKSVNWIMQPSTLSRIMAYAKRSGISGSAVFSALAAILMALIMGRAGSPDISSKKQKSQIIDIDEYTIVDDKR
jgi:hypothetical protein